MRMARLFILNSSSNSKEVTMVLQDYLNRVEQWITNSRIGYC